LLDAIKEKLAECPNLSYKKIAMAAKQEGKNEIALSLLKNEDSIKDQIPILLAMGEYIPALTIAITNCEADIVYGIISEMDKAHYSPEKIINTCAQVEGCSRYLLSYLHQRLVVNPLDSMSRAIYTNMRNVTNPEVMKKLQAAGAVDMDEYNALAEALHASTLKDAKSKISSVLSLPKNVYVRIKPFLESYYSFLDFKATNIDLLKKKGISPAEGFIRAEGLFESLLHLYGKKDFMSIADAMVKRQKVEPKFALMIKLRALAKAREWMTFNDVAKKEKPRLQPQYYAKTCIEFGNTEIAAVYIRDVPDIEQKIEMYMDIE
jgi:hypothetical protein